MRYLYLFITLSIIVNLTMITPSAAFNVCRCEEEQPLEVQKKRAYSIFAGRVKHIRRDLTPHRNIIRFDVYASWKRIRNEEITVYSSARDMVSLYYDGISCGYNFKKGQDYLVFTWRAKNRHGPANVNRCTGTNILALATEDWQALGEPLYSFAPLPLLFPPRADLVTKIKIDSQ